MIVNNKNRLIIILCSLLVCVFVSLLVLCGVEKKSGVFFRKSYGSLGYIGKTGQIYLQAYCINTDPIFLEESVVASCNSDIITIQNIDINLLTKLKDIDVYDLIVNFTFDECSEVSISELSFSYGDKSETYYLGELKLFSIDGEIYSFARNGIDPIIMKNQAYLDIDNSSEDIIVKRIILSDSEWFSYSDDGESFVAAGDTKQIVFSVDSHVSEENWLVLHPIYEIELVGSEKIVYFSAPSDFYMEQELTYDDIINKIVK